MNNHKSQNLFNTYVHLYVYFELQKQNHYLFEKYVPENSDAPKWFFNETLKPELKLIFKDHNQKSHFSNKFG